MKTKKIISTLMAGAVACSMLLTGAGAQGVTEVKADDKVQIRFLNGFTGGDGAYMRKITDGFNESQDKYEIVESQEKDHYLKFKSGEYDLVVIHGDRLKTFVDDGMIQDVSSIYEKAGLELADYLEAAQKIVQVDETTYAFPLDIHPLVMFYNKQLCPEAPKTYEDIKALNEELQAKDPNTYAMGVPGLGLVEYYYMTLANQNGIEIQDGEALKFDTEEFADVLMTYHDMIFTDKVSPSKLGLDGEFKTFVQDEESAGGTQTAIALTGPWYYQAAKEKYGDDLGIAPVPALGKETGVYGNAHTIAVPSRVEDEEVLDGIAEFMKYLYTPENLINWADAGQAPTHVATMEAIQKEADKYPLACANYEQFENCKIAPQVYNVGEQLKYLNENVFNMVVSTEELAKEDLMKELEKATKTAMQVAEGF